MTKPVEAPLGRVVPVRALASVVAIGMASAAAPVFAAAPVPVAPQANVAACDEACLRAALDRFMIAFAARKPADALLAAGARYSENGVELPFGQGLWRTIDSFGSYRNSFYDARAGQAGLFATIVENGVPQLLALRVKLVNGRIAEAEVLIQRRQTSRFLNTQGLTLKPVWAEIVPPEKRVSRDRLAEIANAYLSALSTGSGKAVPFADDCERHENGIQTAGVRRTPPPAGATPSGGSEIQLMRCAQQFDSGSTVYIQSVDPRRVAVIDEARGLVFGIFYFQHPGDIVTIRNPDGTTRAMPEAAIRPFTVPAAEMFKVVDGKIVAIEAVAVTVPYGSPSPWK